MGRWNNLLGRAARRLARDPRVRDKATEFYRQEVMPRATELYQKEVKPRATELYEKQVKPRAKEAWRKGKPKLDAAKTDLRDIAHQTDPRKDPRGFAKRVKEQFLDRNRGGGKSD